MTRKRFTLTFDDKIVDNLTNVTHDVHSGYDVALDLSNLLNKLWEQTNRFAQYNKELVEENEQLKKQSNSIYEIVKEYVMSHHCISTMRMLKKIEKVMWNDL